MATRSAGNPPVASLAAIGDMGKALKANSDALIYKLEDYRKWLEAWLDSDSAGSDSRIIEQIAPLIEDANALALTIRSFRNRSELLCRSVEDAQHAETDDSSETKPRTKERVRAVLLEDENSNVAVTRLDVSRDPLGDVLQERMNDFTSDLSVLQSKFGEFTDTLRKTIIERAIETLWGGQEEYYQVLGQKMKLDSMVKSFTLRNYLERPNPDRRLLSERAKMLAERRSLSGRILLYNHFFVADQNISRTSKILDMKPSTVRVGLSRLRMDISYQYLASYLTEELEREGLERSQLEYGHHYDVVPLGSKKILLYSLVLPIVDETQPSRAMTANVRSALRDQARRLGGQIFSVAGRDGDSKNLYDGIAVVVMSTGGEPMLFTGRQIGSLGDGEYAVGGQKMKEVVWKNPDRDLLLLAEKDSTLARYPDLRTLLDAAVAEGI